MHRKILLIEQDTDLQEFFPEVFDKAGYETYTYASPDCLEKISDELWQRLELIVIDDCQNPNSVYKLIEERCRKLSMSNIATLGIFGEDVNSTDILDCRFSEIIVKEDFNLEDLMSTVADLLED